MECSLFKHVFLPVHRSTLHPLAYEYPSPMYGAETLMKMLLSPKIDCSKICTTWPLQVSHSATFIVDITQLKHPDDVKKDFFGKWQHSGSHPIPFMTRFDSTSDVHVEKCAPGARGSNVFYLRRLHSVHPSNSECTCVYSTCTYIIIHIFVIYLYL